MTFPSMTRSWVIICVFSHFEKESITRLIWGDVGRGEGQEKMATNIICAIDVALFGIVLSPLTVNGHFTNKPRPLTKTYWSVNASLFPYARPRLCFFVVFPLLAANLWPRSPPTRQIFLESCNLTASHMLEAAPFCQRPGFPCCKHAGTIFVIL